MAIAAGDPAPEFSLARASGDRFTRQDLLGAGAACRAFGVLHPGGFPERALVLTGPDAAVRWSHQAATPGELPGANLIFDALAA